MGKSRLRNPKNYVRLEQTLTSIETEDTLIGELRVQLPSSTDSKAYQVVKIRHSFRGSLNELAYSLNRGNIISYKFSKYRPDRKK